MGMSNHILQHLECTEFDLEQRCNGQFTYSSRPKFKMVLMMQIKSLWVQGDYNMLKGHANTNVHSNYSKYHLLI